MVSQSGSGETYTLDTLKGKEIPRHLNAHHLQSSQNSIQIEIKEITQVVLSKVTNWLKFNKRRWSIEINYCNNKKQSLPPTASNCQDNSHLAISAQPTLAGPAVGRTHTNLSAYKARAVTQLGSRHPSKPPGLGCDATIVNEKKLKKGRYSNCQPLSHAVRRSSSSRRSVMTITSQLRSAVVGVAACHASRSTWSR
ncbi:Hypothetical predicted protein [Prunus dulcis]|uniref:Uncharacterized protein n=1 Tax=Prunus dulcis TaxID=3755 RepID=A0A5E4GHE9_PRUDU|nr:Hypothetical predicted protein [Prunus dulcis]